MTWTYLNDPKNRPTDEIRLMIGDINPDDPQLTDEELDYYIEEEGSVRAGAIAAVRGLMAKYARLVNKAVGDLKMDYSSRVDQYKELIQQLTSGRVVRMAGVYAGGTSLADKVGTAENTDRVQPSFRRDQFRFPSTQDQTAGRSLDYEED